ncbi:hypothetical protein [Flavobacterium filum]|uniref:hypothetical protein n=1 Tax=Flavobacterium filum TaxID=370974 RepID=UPI0023F26F82|nr:hypothetical protein [Flavobacterium filum]
MTIEQYEKAKAKRFDVDRLKAIFKDKHWSENPSGELNIGFEVKDGIGFKSINIAIPHYLAENILGLVSKRISQLIEIGEDEFKKL